MTPVVWIKGPSDAGPAERERMLEEALSALAGVDEVVRVDVPARGTEQSEDGELRPAVATLVPAIQSESLFGGPRGVMVVDAQLLTKAEAATLAELLVTAAGATVVLVASGSLPRELEEGIKAHAERIDVRKVRERDAAEWLRTESRKRSLSLSADVFQALLQRFGSDLGALGGALDQLEAADQPVLSKDVLDRFRNRPDEPMWHYADAVAAGNRGEALRRLEDFLTHGHPLQLLAFMEGDLKRRALASASTDLEMFASRVGGRPRDFRVAKDWKRRGSVADSELRKALDGIARADGILKSAPEEVHRVTMERLTVALCTWYGGRSRPR